MIAYIGRNRKEVFIDKEDHEKFFIKGNFINISSHGYVRVLNYIGDYKYKQTYLHRLIMNAPKGMEVDHINGNTLDNRKENLRVCTRLENAKNTKSHGSKYRGVHYSKAQKKWVAQITNNRKVSSLGLYLTPEVAAQAYNQAAKELHGQFARLNLVVN